MDIFRRYINKKKFKHDLEAREFLAKEQIKNAFAMLKAMGLAILIVPFTYAIKAVIEGDETAFTGIRDLSNLKFLGLMSFLYGTLMFLVWFSQKIIKSNIDELCKIESEKNNDS